VNADPSCSFTASIDTYFERGLSPESAHALYGHIPTCAGCRRRYDRRLVLASLLPGSMGPKARLRTSLDVPSVPRTAPRWWATAAAALAVAACLALFARSRSHDDASFHERGATRTSGPRLEVYRLNGPSPRYVTDIVANREELAFAYTNPTAKKRLLVFAVDEHRHVYWYYPAWTVPDERPIAVPIVATRESVELKEGVKHDFDAQLLRLYGVFTDEPMTTTEVEDKLAAMPVLPPRLDWAGTLETSQELEVH